MDTQTQAIQRFVEAIKLDRHDWQDWPKDSREAYAALCAWAALTPQVSLGHASRLPGAAQALVNWATAAGVVITIERRPLKPLAMGHACYDIAVRPLRDKP